MSDPGRAGGDGPRPDGPGPDGAGWDGTGAPRAEPVPPVGTVAEEAARLLEVLSGATGPWPGSARAGASTSQPPGEGLNGHDPDPTEGPAGDSSRTCTCGGTTPQACRVCPVCQLISFVSSINPETIDRVADLVGFAATALRDLATAQRGRQPTTADGSSARSEPS